jgi:tRNA-dihydrouridine synthase B
LKIGKFEYDKPVILAPMAGATDIPFRNLAYELGADFAVTEMIMANSLIYKNPKGFQLMERGSNDNPFIVQIAASEVETFLKALPYIKEVGADILDINMGCPAKKIVTKGSGSALLRNPSKIYDIVKAIKDNIDIPVTVKMRLGWDNEELTYKEVIKNIQNAGADAFTVHRRTKTQMYKGFFSEDVFKEIADMATIPFICNGEINTKEDIKRSFELGCDGVMIGRSAVKHPWIFSKKISEEPSIKEVYKIMKRHFEFIIEYYGEERGINKMKKFYGTYIRDIKGASMLKDSLMPINDYSKAISMIDEFFDNYWSIYE